MTSSELGSAPAEAAPGWVARAASPRVLILAVAALVLTNVLTRYENAGPPDYIWPGLGVLLAVWQIWRRQRLMWAGLTAAAAAALPLYALSVAGVIDYVLPGWWMLITCPADILAAAILVSPPIRRWVANRPAPVP